MGNVIAGGGEGLHDVCAADDEGLDYCAEGEELEGCWGWSHVEMCGVDCLFYIVEV